MTTHGTELNIGTNGQEDAQYVQVRPLNFRRMTLTLVGTAPYMQARFAAKSMQNMADKMKAGQQSRGKKVREARDFDADYEGAMHKDLEGRFGIPAGAFRNAMISACRTIGFKMTIAKLSVFVDHDSLDAVDGTPLVFISGEPERTQMPVRNATGVVDIRVRPMWRAWTVKLRIKWDGDQFSQQDVVNLLARAGAQVGVGEGRPDSKASAGLGFGTWALE